MKARLVPALVLSLALHAGLGYLLQVNPDLSVEGKYLSGEIHRVDLTHEPFGEAVLEAVAWKRPRLAPLSFDPATSTYEARIPWFEDFLPQRSSWLAAPELDTRVPLPSIYEAGQPVLPELDRELAEPLRPPLQAGDLRPVLSLRASGIEGSGEAGAPLAVKAPRSWIGRSMAWQVAIDGQGRVRLLTPLEMLDEPAAAELLEAWIRTHRWPASGREEWVWGLLTINWETKDA